MPPADPSALAQGIRELLADWEGQQARAVAARDRIEAQFGWPQVAGRTLEVYEQVCEAPHARR